MFLKTSRFLKYFGFALIAAGIPTLLLDKTQGSELPLLLGLFFVFTSTEKVEDERTATIRFSSLTIAFLTCYIIEFVSSYLFIKGFISWHLTEIKHFIILVFALALSMFYTRLYLNKKPNVTK